MTTKAAIRKFGSLFFLGLFLWFYAVKDIHDVVHGDDVHCHVQNAKHFHTQEHHCPICDVVLPYFDEQKPHVEVSVHNFFIKVENAVLPAAVSFETVSLLPSRAPPLV
jgi:hypothetical protein